MSEWPLKPQVEVRMTTRWGSERLAAITVVDGHAWEIEGVRENIRAELKTKIMAEIEKRLDFETVVHITPEVNFPF